MTKIALTSIDSATPSPRSEREGMLGVVIVNWNSRQYLRQCLHSFAQCEDLDRVSMIVVVDNNSHDDSLQNLPSLSVPFRLIKNDTNRGFAAACNQGAAICESTYLLFLNPDTTLRANSLRVPLEFLDEQRNSDVGICGIQLIDAKGKISRTCSRLPTFVSLFAMTTRLYTVLPRRFPPHFMKEWDHQATRAVEEVIGAFFFVRRSLFSQLGGFDERFFVYFEEVDFCERSRRLGHRTMYLSTGQAEHIGGVCSTQIRGRSLFYSLKSRVVYAQKHLSRRQAIAIGAMTFLLEPAIRMVSSILRLRIKNILPLGYGFLLLWWDRFVASMSLEPAAQGTKMRSESVSRSTILDESTLKNPQQTQSAA